MTELKSDQRDERLNLLIYVFICVLIAVAMIIAYISISPKGEKRELFGIDGYVHLTRAAQLYETGDWYHPARMKTNTPYGDTLPWSRPFDVLLLAGAIPLSAFMDFDTALFWWGVMISPFLLTLMLIAAFWASKPVLKKDAGYFLVFVLLFQLRIISCFRAARPDHHGFLALLFVLVLGFGLRLVMQPFSRRLCWLAGAAVALSVWASIESMVVVGLTVVIMGGFWLFQQGDFLKKNLHFTLSIAICVTGGLLAERPFSEIAAVEFDRISVVYVFFLVLIAVFWMTAYLIGITSFFQKSFVWRIIYSVIGIAAVAFLMFLAFPKFYKGPLADMDSRIIPIFMDYVQELQPLLQKTGTLILFIQLLASLSISIVFLFYMLFNREEADNFNGWFLLLVVSGLYSLLAFRESRWTIYPNILLCIPMAELLYRTLNVLKNKKQTFILALAKSIVLVTFGVGSLGLGFLADSVFERKEDASNKSCDSFVSLCEYLNAEICPESGTVKNLSHFLL